MNMFKATYMAIAFMTYMVMAGLVTQIGVVINPLAEYLNISMTESGAMFSFLTGGTLIGTTASMYIYSHFTIKKVFQVIYSIFLITMACLVVLDIRDQTLVSAYFLILGFCCGAGLSGGAVLISQVFEEKQRASAFIATDCAFSASGMIFPALTVSIMAASMLWTKGYAAVAVCAAIILVGSFTLKFPKGEVQESSDEEKVESKGSFKDIFTVRVMIMGIAVCLYLIGQNTFVSWGPNYLQSEFGVAAAESGAVIGNYWGPALFGLIVSTIIVAKIPARLFLAAVVVIAAGFTIYLAAVDNAEQFLTVTLGFGFLTSSLFKLAISVGSMQLRSAPAVLVTFLLTCGTVGSTLAPAVSSAVVEKFGIASSMTMTVVCFVSLAGLVLACLGLEKTESAKEAATA
ncbi:MFS transporter TsgA [Vibrio sp. HN007]|uniref:MFS transporter TsgA n=1 Tax=Vibrio iocasae TaxID=3098914 RepID=UPI0035D4A3DE